MRSDIPTDNPLLADAPLPAFSAIRPEHVYRHKWRVGDALLWDNRCTQHCATAWDDSKYTRRMQRTTLEGEVPIMADRAVFRDVPKYKMSQARSIA